MTCKEACVELVESARNKAGIQTAPGRELRDHLAACGRCGERWEAERQLSAHLAIARTRTASLRSRESRREALLQEFSRTHQRRFSPAWAWTLAAAAAVLLAVLAGWNTGTSRQRTIRPAADRSLFYETSADAAALSSDDFVAIPYTLPLAQGEIVRMVHANLYPEALAGMGVDVDPSWGLQATAAGALPVDIVVGEDGLPRAVRITENGQF